MSWKTIGHGEEDHATGLVRWRNQASSGLPDRWQITVTEFIGFFGHVGLHRWTDGNWRTAWADDVELDQLQPTVKRIEANPLAFLLEERL